MAKKIIENEDLRTAKSMLESIVFNNNSKNSNLKPDLEREHLKQEMAKALKEKYLQ